MIIIRLSNSNNNDNNDNNNNNINTTQYKIIQYNTKYYKINTK